MEDIGLKKYKIHHGMKNDHPLNHVKFFDKKDKMNQPQKLARPKLESMVPRQNQAWIVRCYVKSNEESKV